MQCGFELHVHRVQVCVAPGARRRAAYHLMDGCACTCVLSFAPTSRVNAFVFTDVVHVQVHSRCNGMRSTDFIHEYACRYNGAHARMYISDTLPVHLQNTCTRPGNKVHAPLD